MSDPLDLDAELQRHARSLRALAGDLVGDRHLAEDVLQEAAQRTLAAPPARGGPLVGWLRTVVHNLACQERRRQRRRLAREQAVARPEAQPSVAELLARREALRTVTDAVLALEEPFQSTVFLRYFEGLEPTVIARRTGAPLATVKSRLQRGLAQLREHLDRKCGGERSRWLAALGCAFGAKLPWLPPGWLTTGTIVMGNAGKIGLGLATAAAAVAVVWTFAHGAEVTPVATTTTQAEPLPVAAATTVDESTTASERLLAAVEDVVEAGLEHPFVYELTVLVRDRDGLPVAGTGLQLAPRGCAANQVTPATDDDGRTVVTWRGKTAEMDMVLVSPGDTRTFRVRAGQTTLMVGGRASTGSRLEEVIRGRLLVDAASVAKGRFTYSASAALAVDPRAHLTQQPGVHPHASFADALAAGIPHVGADVRLTESVLAIDSLSANLRLWTDAEFVIAKGGAGATGSAGARVTGIVRDITGKPRAGVTVVWGNGTDRPLDRTKTDDHGEFGFDAVPEGWLELRAGGGDGGLARARQFVGANGQVRWEATLDPASVLHGTARDQAGAALAGWHVEWTNGVAWDKCTIGTEGRWELPNHPGGAGTLLLHREGGESKLPVAVLGDAIPDSGALQFTFDASVCQGQLQIEPLLPDELSGSTVAVHVWQEDSGRGATMDRVEDSARQRLAGLPAGWYRVEVHATRCGTIDAGRHWVDGRGLVDLGRLQLPRPGTVRFERDDATLPPNEQRVLEICQRRPTADIRAETVEANVDLVTLPAGDYVALWRDRQGRRQHTMFSVQSGRETIVRQ